MYNQFAQGFAVHTTAGGATRVLLLDRNGILTGGQHNTLDAKWYGKITWLSLHYTAALRAAAAMADEMGDTDYARQCRDLADRGRQYIETALFNGEYFIHEPDPNHPKSPGVFTGCEYSQLFGQSWAYQVGLGQILDPQKVTTALNWLWRYNFSTDVGPFREKFCGGRWYAMPGEGGLIACTWPHGGSEALALGNRRFAEYSNECQDGYEYAATSLMMWHGLVDKSLAHTKMMHERYDASKRNPWNEIEWGSHYSRSMASYGPLPPERLPGIRRTEAALTYWWKNGRYFGDERVGFCPGTCTHVYAYAQAASHLLREGLTDEGLAVVRGIHERYDGAKHNPWNEIEGGDHYARAMASWGCILAVSGFEYDGPAGKIGFAPKITPENFESFFSAAEGWGSLSQKVKGNTQQAVIAVKWDKVSLKEITPVPAGSKHFVKAAVRLGSKPLSSQMEQKDGRLVFRMDKQVVIPAGERLEIQLTE